MLVPKMDT